MQKFSAWSLLKEAFNGHQGWKSQWRRAAPKAEYDAIVIGGGVGNLDELYESATREAIRSHLFNPELRTELLRPALGDSAGVFGAAMLCAD